MSSEKYFMDFQVRSPHDAKIKIALREMKFKI